jgi:hypothetical protein
LNIRRLGSSVAVDQREAAVGLDLEHGLGDRQGDPAAGSERDVMLAGERIERGAECFIDLSGWRGRSLRSITHVARGSRCCGRDGAEVRSAA